MNFYELIYLENEFKTKLTNGRVRQIITPFKNLLEIYIDKDEESFRLIFSCSPGNTALFIDGYREAKKSNRLLFFKSVYGSPLKNIKLEESDRMLTFEFQNEKKILFKLFSNKANAVLIENETVIESFKDHDELGKSAPSGKKVIFSKEICEESSVKEKIIAANPLLSRSIIDDLVKSNKLESKSSSEIIEFVELLTEQVTNHPVFRTLENGIITSVSEEFLEARTLESFASANELIAYRFKNYSHTQRLRQQKGLYVKAIQRQLKRIKSSLSKLSQADKGIEKSEVYEKYGHLLMANAHQKGFESQEIRVSDLYNSGELVAIPLQEGLSLVENAEHYYQRASSSVQSYKEAIKQIPKLEERAARLSKMKIALEEINHLRDIEDWRKKYKKEIENLGLESKRKQESMLPFHQLQIKGYQVWIGKNAKSNDKLVQLSHKEDIWMHARGVPGSHLIIRMMNAKSMPSKDIIEEAASYAAFNSKAKGSALVPVIYTKRKFVRKPKGAAPGAVLVQKEEVALVKPIKPIL